MKTTLRVAQAMTIAAAMVCILATSYTVNMFYNDIPDRIPYWQTYGCPGEIKMIDAEEYCLIEIDPIAENQGLNMALRSICAMAETNDGATISFGDTVFRVEECKPEKGE